MIKGFTVHNWKAKLIRFPSEESYNFDSEGKILSVADGITRDCVNGAVADTSRRGLTNIFLHYPRPSPAKIVADIFTKTFYEFLSNLGANSPLIIDETFRLANERIRDFNLGNFPKTNYLDKDLAGCTTSGVFREGEVIHWGYIADCGVAVIDKNGNLKFKTEDEGPSKFYTQRWEDERLKGLKWKDDEARLITRRDYRNNLENEFSYGVLTGEESAMDYVKTGSQEINSKDFVLVYSDGIAEFIFKKDGDIDGTFIDSVRKRDGSLERLCKEKIRTEGSLIISSVDQ